MEDFTNRLKKINGNTLKVIACISMLIDHMTAGIMLPVVRGGLYDGSLTIDQLNTIYRILRGIGRTAFPIYCFLLVEGFTHTRSKLRYALSLLLFGLISEAPFDLLFFAKNEVFNINIMEALEANSTILNDQCNVYFTLLIGLLVIWVVDEISTRLHARGELFTPAIWLCYAVFTGIGCLIAYKLNTDYDIYGVVFIVILYSLRKYEYIRILLSYFFLSQLGSEFYAFPAFILMALYNHKKGRNLGNFKYLFYLFYPVHLLCIYIYRCLMYG